LAALAALLLLRDCIQDALEDVVRGIVLRDREMPKGWAVEHRGKKHNETRNGRLETASL